MPDVFRAGVLYDDWLGTSAADDADQNDLHHLLVSRKLLQADEQLLGLELSFWENIGSDVRPHVRVLVGAESEKIDLDRSVPVRELELEISLIEFCSLFKRFSVTLSRCRNGSGILEGKNIDVSRD